VRPRLTRGDEDDPFPGQAGIAAESCFSSRVPEGGSVLGPPCRAGGAFGRKITSLYATSRATEYQHLLNNTNERWGVLFFFVFPFWFFLFVSLRIGFFIFLWLFWLLGFG